MKKISICLAGLAVFMTGCVVPKAPVRQDPFAGLDFDSPPSIYSDLTLAIIPSENTRNSMEYGIKGSRMARFDINELFQKDFDMYKRNFRAVYKVDTMPEAQKSNADMIAILDILVEAGRTFKIETDVIFFDTNRNPLDTIHAEVEQKYGAAAGMKMLWGGKAGPPASIEKALTKQRNKLERALLASAKLAAYAKTRVPAAATAAKTAAPPARVYHSDVDRPRYKTKPDPNNFALVIGIEKYSILPQAEFAERDAEAVQKHLLALGYPQRNILFLTGSQAGRASIEKYLESWLPRNVKEDSRVFFYFSGHGAPDTKTGQAYLVPWDGDPRFLKNTGYPLKRLYENLNALKAREIIVAMDACFSGAGGRSVIPKGTRPLVTRVDTGADKTGKLTVFSASAADEITGTEESQGHGLFTYYFLKGLNGEAKDKRGKVTAKGLYDYLLPHVQDAARRENRDQTPALMGAKQERVVIRK